MSVRIATFNVENLMSRFDFSGFGNAFEQDRVLSLYEIGSEEEYRALVRANTIAHADDTRQLSALAIANARADILFLQEVDNLAALKAFDHGYLYRMMGSGYREKHASTGNDVRGIDVAVMMRKETAHGRTIEFVQTKTHAGVTYRDFDLHTAELAALGLGPDERIFKRDCLEIDVKIDGRPWTFYVVHFKAMSPPRDGMDGREASMPIRIAEAAAVRRIIEQRFGAGQTANKRWVICGDLNDYRERVVVGGDAHAGFTFEVAHEVQSSVNVLTDGGFCENVVERRPELDRWTLYHTRGPDERHLCQLDYLLLSPALARQNADAVPDIVRGGQPWRTVFPPGQEVERYPRTGWDRPKASDHCPVAITLDVP